LRALGLCTDARLALQWVKMDKSTTQHPMVDPGRPDCGIVVVAHAPLASAYASVARHVHGELPQTLAVVDVAPWQPPEMIAAKTLALLTRKHWDRVLFLVDLHGATPFHIACRVAASWGDRARILTGLNAGMLLSAIERQSDADLNRLARAVAVRARRAVQVRTVASDVD
jgi:PTS system ascorbate-specific IIA component